MNQSVVDTLFYTKDYINKYQTKEDISALLYKYKGLKPIIENYLFNNGAEKQLICLRGTIPVPFKDQVYNIPIDVWILDTHPYESPHCYVKPTNEMNINEWKNVDHNGRIYLQYLYNWSAKSSDLITLIELIIIEFSVRPPLFTKRKNAIISPQSKGISQINDQNFEENRYHPLPEYSPSGYKYDSAQVILKTIAAKKFNSEDDISPDSSDYSKSISIEKLCQGEKRRDTPEEILKVVEHTLINCDVEDEINPYSNDYSKHNSRELSFKTRNLKHVHFIGKGSFVSVHKYINTLEDQFYAIKEVTYSESNTILQEIKTMAHFKSNFVVQYNTSWIENNTLFIQMEYCFENMKNILNNKRKAFERSEDSIMNCTEYYISCEIFRQITEALNYLHTFKPIPIIHRDLKPENILIGNSNNQLICKLSDFGLSKFINNRFSTHSAVGTPKYVAPEVSATNDSNKSKYDIKADIWSLGIIGLEIFDIEDEDSINFYENNELKENIEIIEEIFRTKLLNSRSKQRMSCKELLGEINTWFIDKGKVGSDLQTNHFIEKFVNEMNFLYFHNILLNVNE